MPLPISFVALLFLERAAAAAFLAFNKPSSSLFANRILPVLAVHKNDAGGSRVVVPSNVEGWMDRTTKSASTPQVPKDDEFLHVALEMMDQQDPYHVLDGENNASSHSTTFSKSSSSVRNDNHNAKKKSTTMSRTAQQQRELTTNVTKKKEQQHHYESLPFSLIVGHDLVKRALLIAAVDPSLSVLLYGPKGTGKSVLARALYHLLPPSSSEATSAVVPKVHVPLHCQEDALLGTVDLERSLATGQAILEPGLLHKAHQGLLIVDDVHLLEPELAHILWNAVDGSHNVTVEREGLSATYPCRPLAIATMNPEEEQGDNTMQSWVDRIAMRLPVETVPSVLDRVQAVASMERFLDHYRKEDEEILEQAVQEDALLRSRVAEARRTLPFVQPLSSPQLEYLCREASAADCEGQRGEIFAAQIARASAALQQRIVVNAQDLQIGVLLSIAPRARRAFIGKDEEYEEDEEDGTTSNENNSMMSPPDRRRQPPPPPPPPQQNVQPDDETQTESTDETPPEEEPEQEITEQELLIPDQFLFSPDFSTPLDPRLLHFQQQWTRKGKKGKGARIFNLKRGRFVKAVFPPPGMIHQGKIAVGATLRAAAPFQKSRREHAKDKTKLIYIRDDDIRLQRMKRKAGSLILFVVDASGSMALNRMSVAKGAALTLLQEAYKSRDQISLIAFHDEQAEILVPPTKSMALASTRLEQMPCGGRSPLAHAMVTALRTSLNAVKVKHDVGRVVIVLITDGRPTIPLCVSEGGVFDSTTIRSKDPLDVKPDGQASRKFCEKEVYAIARQMGTASKDLDVLVIDTEDKFVATGVAQEIARLCQGSYYAIDTTGNAAEIVATTRKHVEEFRKTK
ncbi:hypothetical protein ACA910_016484 [Epithemia clementina (nom. ined.)]